jgi:hypothetical protein
MKLAMAYLELDTYPSLEEICTIAGIDRSQFGDTHRALVDILSIVALLKLFGLF